MLKVIFNTLVLVVAYCLFFNGYSRSEFSNFDLIDTEEKLIKFLQDATKWKIPPKKYEGLDSDDEIYYVVELLSVLRTERGFRHLVESLSHQVVRYYGPPRKKQREFVVLAVAASAVDGSDIELILEKVFEKKLEYKGYCCLEYLLPFESTNIILDDFIAKKRKKYRNDDDDMKQLETINDIKKLINVIIEHDVYERRNLHTELSLSKFTLNHPLYKARQLAIKTNLELAQRILNSNKNLSLIDAESKLQLLTAIEELAKMRAVEAVEILAPILLLQSDKEIVNLDKKYFSLQKYPVGIALAKIGIPSIWGLLDEVAKRSDNADEYRKIAHNVMTTILIEKAISGFVNEILIKYKDDELAQIRLAKLLLLLGEDAEKIALLKPRFRIWKSTDGLFETNAKFISLDKNNEVKLEKENGNKTTIELHALQKNDQDYVKEFITINKK